MNSTAHHAGNKIEDRWPLEPMVEIVLALQGRSDWTWRHLGRVARYAVAFGRQLGLDAEAIMTLHCAAMLHDAGKVAVPDEILDKTSPLDRDEWYAITKHSMMSGQMLKVRSIPRGIAKVAQSHHEWYNGQGYPLGLEGEAIPLGARILSLADSYDAMSNDRPYRRALEHQEAMQEIERGVGTQFDPALVGLLKPLMEAGPEQLVPRRTMRVVSDDPALFREIWFATHPYGWEILPWPEVWVDACPVELRGDSEAVSHQANVALTVIDGRSIPRLPGLTIDGIEGPILWIDSGEGQLPALRRPLDLQHLLSALEPAGEWRWGRSRAEDCVSVLVADPFKLFRQALVRYLEDQEEVRVVGTADSPEAYRLSLESGGFDVVVVASDFVEGTRTTRELRPGETLLAAPGGCRGQAPLVPSVVLVADEDLAHKTGTSDKPRPHLWQPGQRVEGRSVRIPRGAPAEMLVAAIKTVRMSREVESGSAASVDSLPLPWNGDGLEEQSGAWS